MWNPLRAEQARSSRCLPKQLPVTFHRLEMLGGILSLETCAFHWGVGGVASRVSLGTLEAAKHFGLLGRTQ